MLVADAFNIIFFADADHAKAMKALISIKH
jgi:hypothetical protein